MPSEVIIKWRKIIIIINDSSTNIRNEDFTAYEHDKESSLVDESWRQSYLSWYITRIMVVIKMYKMTGREEFTP